MAKISVSRDFSGLPALLSGERQVFIVYDLNLSAEAEQIAALVPGVKGMIGITADEDHKVMDTVVGICTKMMEADADRGAFVLNVGGGVTTDMGGFAACIYKRGVRYANVPTTLLSQVDAGIGGKTGVNLLAFKNELGIIRQPEFVYINTSVLATLPQQQMASGIAEMLKTFIIGSAEDYRLAVQAIAEGGDLTAFIGKAAAIKQSVVDEDADEKGLRRVLNLGHTFAHAIEWAQHSGLSSGVVLSHGEAVAAGMVIAANVSQALGICPESLVETMKKDFAACGLPTQSPVALPLLRSALLKDKKAEDGSIHFVLVRDFGKVETRKMTVKNIYDLLGYTE